MLTIDDVIERFDGSLAYSTNSKEICQYIADLLKELKERRKAPEIVRCGECARRRTMCDGKDRCTVFNVFVDSDGYCKWSERKIE